MFSQIAIIVLGVYLIAVGFQAEDTVNMVIGFLVAVCAGFTLYQLKTGK